MPRPKSDTVIYFPHYANASSEGATVKVLQGRFGNDGYAFWFKLLEKLASTDGHYLDCRSKPRWQVLLADLGVDEQTGVEMMVLLVEMEAIDKELWESKVIWCQNLVDNLEPVYKNRKREIPPKPIITGRNEITIPKNGVSASKLSVEIPQRRGEGRGGKDNNTTAAGGEPGDEFSEQDPNLTAMVICYEQNIGIITPMVAEELKDLAGRFSPEWFAAAVKEAVNSNARRLKYIKSILERWEVEGFKAPKKERSKMATQPEPIPLITDFKPDPKAEKVWAKALAELEKQVSESNFKTWLSPTRAVSFKKGVFVIGVQNVFVAKYLEENQRSLIERVIIGLTTPGVKVIFGVFKGKPG